MPSARPGDFELLVLLAAWRLGPAEAYAVSIAEEIGERTGRKARRSNVYTALKRLESRDLVTTALGEPRPERGGKARRLVELTPAGVAAVRASLSDLTALSDGLPLKHVPEPS